MPPLRTSDGALLLPSTPDTVLWGWLPNRDTPLALHVEDGDVVAIETVSHEGILEDQGRDPVAWFGRHGIERSDVLADAREIAASDISHEFGDGPHIVTGPIRVNGAQPGDVLKVEVLQLELRAPYGVISNRHGLGCLAGEFPETTVYVPGACAARPELYGSVSHFTRVEESRGTWFGLLPYGTEGRVARFPLAPFLGIMGVAPDTSQPVPSVPPGDHGGNIDINLLNTGAILYLPVQVEGAGFHAGDPHYAQGDGEVALTALEAPLSATLRLSVLKGPRIREAVGVLDRPFVETETHWIPVGLDRDLDEAMRKATRAAVRFLETAIGMGRAEALAYLSAAADFEISQVVDTVKGVHCCIRKADFG